MGIVREIGQKALRKSFKSSASLLGLAAGAVGWSGLAQAASEETGSQVMLLPEHYEVMENGVVVFRLETGENLSLTSDQYLILEDGLLLITDELAQASIYSLPVMGSVRAQFLSDLEQVATIDGTVAEATPAQTLSITEGQAPRLSEQVELQSYEVAQASDEASSETEEALALGMSIAPVATALLGVLMISDQPEPEPQLRMWDLRPGENDGYPDDFAAIGGNLYFQATHPVLGDELWVYDGVNDPYVLADIRDGSSSSYPAHITGFDGKVVFRADDGTSGNELWTYDNVNGPQMVYDINPGSDGASLGRGIVFKGKYYFAANDGINGTELWSWDGQNDPSMVMDIDPGSDASSPSTFTKFGNELYFIANDTEIWSFNGTDDPSLVTTSPDGYISGMYGPDSWGFVKYKGEMYLKIDELGGSGDRLYSFDGVNAPELVYDPDATGYFYISDLLSHQGNLYFNGYDDDGEEGNVYVFDGVNDPSIAFDVNPNGSDGIEDLFSHEGNLWFGARFDGRDELWTWDGDNAPYQVTDIRLDGGADPWKFTSFDGKIFFQAETDEFGEELWAYG